MANFVGYVVWSVWLIILAVKLLRRGEAITATGINPVATTI
jgi:hypothetical protein